MHASAILYDAYATGFHLSLCYADSKTLTITYDKMEYCDWKEDDTAATAHWDLSDLTQDIINDLEGAVPSKLTSGN